MGVRREGGREQRGAQHVREEEEEERKKCNEGGERERELVVVRGTAKVLQIERR